MRRSSVLWFIAAVAFATLVWACLDFKHAYDDYCATPGRCDAGLPGSPDSGSPDSGSPDSGNPPDGGGCGNTGDPCQGPFDCCNGRACHITGPTGACEVNLLPYLPNGFACYASDQCEFGFCNAQGLCASPPPGCTGVYALCASNNKCCSQFACFPGLPDGCREPDNTPCTKNSGCIDFNCKAGKCAACEAQGNGCAENQVCCSRNCKGGICQACIPNGNGPGNTCSEHIECCDKNCDAASGKCCLDLSYFCTQPSDCCAGTTCGPPDSMGNKVCCYAGGHACLFDGDCCSTSCNGTTNQCDP